MKCVHRTIDRSAAHLLRGALEADGIPCTVVGEELSSLRGGAAPAYTEFRVCVLDDEQLPAAEAFKAAWLAEADAAPSGSGWRCQACGELHEPNFTDCWKCGAERAPSD